MVSIFKAKVEIVVWVQASALQSHKLDLEAAQSNFKYIVGLMYLKHKVDFFMTDYFYMTALLSTVQKSA